MFIKNEVNKIIFYFLSALPISMIIGSTISLINIVIFSLLFIIIYISEKDKSFLKTTPIKLMLLLYFYLIFNSLISQNYQVGLARNLGFLRFLFLFICINYYFYKYNNPNNFFSIWMVVILLVIIDVFIEFSTGSNIFGWGAIEIDGVLQPNGKRVVSFFKDEPIVGSYLSGFIMIIFGFLLQKLKYKNYLPWLFILLSFSAILISGERSTLIKVFLGLTLMLLFFDFINIKKKLVIVVFTILSLIVIFNQSDYLKMRYFDQFILNFTTKEKLQKFIDKSDYFKLYRSGFAVYKNYQVFGVGNKNYRVETCKDFEKNKKYNYVCQTHPHQIYIELLSEHGIVGTLILLSIFFILIFKILTNIFISKNYIQIGSFCFVVFTFTPLLPSGALFSNFNSIILWLNISIMFAVCKKTNIFSIKT